MTNEKNYPYIKERTSYIPTLGADGKIRSIPNVFKTYLPVPTEDCYKSKNGLIPVINKGEPIRYVFSINKKQECQF